MLKIFTLVQLEHNHVGFEQSSLHRPLFLPEGTQAGSSIWQNWACLSLPTHSLTSKNTPLLYYFYRQMKQNYHTTITPWSTSAQMFLR